MVKQIEVNGEQVILGGNGALVASKSQPGVWYVVRAGQCQCKGYQYRSRCRHLDAVKSYSRAHQSQDDWYFNNVQGVA